MNTPLVWPSDPLAQRILAERLGVVLASLGLTTSCCAFTLAYQIITSGLIVSTPGGVWAVVPASAAGLAGVAAIGTGAAAGATAASIGASASGGGAISTAFQSKVMLSSAKLATSKAAGLITTKAAPVGISKVACLGGVKSVALKTILIPTKAMLIKGSILGLLGVSAAVGVLAVYGGWKLYRFGSSTGNTGETIDPDEKNVDMSSNLSAEASENEPRPVVITVSETEGKAIQGVIQQYYLV